MSRNLTSENSPDEPISLEIPIETPECVRMTYRLAGPAARCGAYLLDCLLRGAVLLVVLMLIGCAGLAASLPGMTTGIALLLLFFVEWGYFAICEGFFGGRTIGKKALGLRVVKQHGYPLSPWPALVRNLLRAADNLAFFGIGLTCMVLSRRFQRVGDLAAGTLVIQERPVRLPREPVILETIRPLDRNQIGSYVPSERTLTLIDEFLTRRTNGLQKIAHGRGHAMARELALTLADKLDYTGDKAQVEQYSMAFLARVYVTFLRRSEDEQEPAGRPRTLAGSAS